VFFPTIAKHPVREAISTWAFLISWGWKMARNVSKVGGDAMIPCSNLRDDYFGFM
jgi:hypothetical protein